MLCVMLCVLFRFYQLTSASKCYNQSSQSSLWHQGEEPPKSHTQTNTQAIIQQTKQQVISSPATRFQNKRKLHITIRTKHDASTHCQINSKQATYYSKITVLVLTAIFIRLKYTSKISSLEYVWFLPILLYQYFLFVNTCSN